ncbi:PREDICTED: protein FAM186A [Ceratotherium simum simum]|uniref:Protein FAM186A n=1 Tax=Ceratotherium simum simum TaxID=73337 RepID=A0ABM1CRP4_CERSS|nr:PREDICTED: protein FAM186A [Ceratotherium simum simum]
MQREIDKESDSENGAVDYTIMSRKALDSSVVPLLEIPFTAQDVISRIEQAQLCRAREDVNMRLGDIMLNVQRIINRYTVDEHVHSGRKISLLEHKKRRTNLLEKMVTYTKAAEMREKILVYILACLEEWNAILSEMTEIDIEEHHHWIAQMQILPETFKAIEGNVKILSRISTSLLEEKRKQKKKITSRSTLWKSWKERVIKRPATAHALRPDQMISDEFATNTKVSEIQDMLQELIGTAMFNKLENNAIKYISSTIVNLSKALRTLNDEVKVFNLQSANMYINETSEREKELSLKIIQDLSEKNEMLQQKLQDAEEKREQLIRSKAIVERQVHAALPTSTLKVLPKLSPQSSMVISKADVEDSMDSVLAKELENIVDEAQRKGTKASGIKWDSTISYTAQVEMTPDLTEQQYPLPEKKQKKSSSNITEDITEDKISLKEGGVYQKDGTDPYQLQKTKHTKGPDMHETSGPNLSDDKGEYKVSETKLDHHSELQALEKKKKERKSSSEAKSKSSTESKSQHVPADFLSTNINSQGGKSGTSSVWDQLRKVRPEHSLDKSQISSEKKEEPTTESMAKESKSEMSSQAEPFRLIQLDYSSEKVKTTGKKHPISLGTTTSKEGKTEEKDVLAFDKKIKSHELVKSQSRITKETSESTRALGSLDGKSEQSNLLTPQQAQAQGISLTPQQAQAQGITLTPEQAQALGVTVTPQQAQEMGITLTPQQAQEMGITLTPQQAQALGMTLTPQQAQAQGITLTSEQFQALMGTLTSEKPQGLGVTLTSEQIQALGPLTSQQAQSLEGSLTPEQARLLQGLLVPEQAQALLFTLAPEKAWTLGITRTHEQAQGVDITLTPEQARALAVPPTLDRAQALKTPLTAEQAQKLGVPIAPKVVEEVSNTLILKQIQALGITSSHEQAQTFGIPFTLDQAHEVGVPVISDKAHALESPHTPEQVQPLGAPFTPGQAQPMGTTFVSEQDLKSRAPLIKEQPSRLWTGLPSGHTLDVGIFSFTDKSITPSAPRIPKQSPTLAPSTPFLPAGQSVTSSPRQFPASSAPIAEKSSIFEVSSTPLQISRSPLTQAPFVSRKSLGMRILSDSGKLLAPQTFPSSRQIPVSKGQSTSVRFLTPEVPPIPGKLPIPGVPPTPGQPLISGVPPTSAQIPSLWALSPGKPLVPGASSIPGELLESGPLTLSEQSQAFQPPATHEQSPYLQAPSTLGQHLAPWTLPRQASPLWIPPTPGYPPTLWIPSTPGKPQKDLSSFVSKKSKDRLAIISSLKSKSVLAHPSAPNVKITQAPFTTEKFQISEVSDTSEEIQMLHDPFATEQFRTFQSYLTNYRTPVSQTPYIDEGALPTFMKPVTSLPSLTTQLPKTPQISPSEWDQKSRFPPIDKPWMLTSVSVTKKPKMRVPPSSPQELKEQRYFVDVEAQRKNLILLSQATKASGLRSELHTTARNLIIETLHTDTVRLGYLFRKYIAYRLIQRARNNIIKQLQAIQNTGKGYESRNLYIMLSRIDDYQKKVMWLWTKKQKSLEQKRNQCLRNMIFLFSQLQDTCKLNLSQPIPLIIHKKQIPASTKFVQWPFLGLLIQEDRKSDIFKKFRQEDQMEAIWNADLSTSSYPITEKTSIHSLWAQLGGYPDIPMLLQLDVQSTFRKSLAFIQSQ